MATTIPSDPYKILGVEPDADAAAIKKAYRRLALVCHPDKVTDESLKAQKQDEFHQIQQAYETIGDPDKRTRYDLELRAKKLREERDRTAPRSSPMPPRHVNVNVNLNTTTPEFRSSSSRHSPSKAKPYSADFSRSWEHSIPTRSRTYDEETRRTRRTVSDEKLKRDRDESRDRRKREEREREREREKRRQREREDEERRRKHEKAARREREDREAREAQLAAQNARQERKARERALERDRIERQRLERERAERDREARRADERSRSKAKPYAEHYSDESDDRKSRPSKKTAKKDSLPRDKSASKRASPREEVPEVPALPADSEDKLQSNMAFAASYIKTKSQAKAQAKHSMDAHFSSAEYPDPDSWAPPKRRGSADAKQAKVDATTDAPSTPRAPPPLQKSYTMGHIPTTDSFQPRFPLSRSQTMESPEYYSSSRPGAADKHRTSRGRSSFEDDGLYPPSRVQKYKVASTDKGTPRVLETVDAYSRVPAMPFGGKVKTSEYDDPSTGRPYRDEVRTSKYARPAYADYQSEYQTAYVAAHS